MIQAVLRRRDAIQMEYDLTVEELNKKKDEREHVSKISSGFIHALKIIKFRAMFENCLFKEMFLEEHSPVLPRKLRVLLKLFKEKNV